MRTKLSYCLPISKDKIVRIETSKSHAHRIYPCSVDFLVPEGTPIKAAADGLVIDVKVDSDKGGADRKFEKYENFIEIRHGGYSTSGHRHADEYSYYGHIKKGGALVKIGDKVKAGQIIGYSGKTGWLANLNEPHLHFMVGHYDYQTLKIHFR